ncbi:sigma-70 family RNA polymerase sigma factor [Paenibacillus sp. L3-i20]|uniref:sigma-70 family RNA polymerase sigma factor n=1 Tax=Paenibacillus sp. L3-i20 TaxID=2905833 RepID=UPI001EDDF0D3|nr:sigma-70 family RNA polymerase sigma factor [Paenibacillus sp. L3-i20]GKU77408.1 hypothetical protein L3i20_v218050 [Paenibacillus sp. L3-i20]
MNILTNSEKSDYQLVIDVQSGNFDAFRSIVLRYSNALLSVAFNIVGNYHDAQDVVQEAFIKSYNQMHTLNDPNKLGSWLYSITFRTSHDFIRRKKPTLPYNDSTTPKADNVHSWLDGHVIHEAIWSALHTLDEKNKSAIILYYLSDWSMKEIGQFMSLSISAVESRIRRARETLRLHLAEDFETYFNTFRLGHHFEQKVSGQIIKGMGHFYIPATNRKKTTDWFVRHFHLEISKHGNLLLELGHELYVLQCHGHSPLDTPILSFSISNAEQLWFQLSNNGVIADPIQHDAWLGKHFTFYDPDHNKYIAVDNN